VLERATVTGCWLIRPSPASPLLGQMRVARVPLLLAVMLVARVGSTAMMLLMWGLVGGALLSGDPAAAPLSLWSLCLLSVIPLRMTAGWAEGRMALVSGAVLKEALLHGILNLDRSAMRTHGVGQFMGMTMEGENASTAVESSLAVFAALLDLFAALLVLALGATGLVHVALFVGWIALTAWLTRRYIAQAVRWTTIDRAVTNDLVERLIGYQTRLVQERPERRHADEDRLLCDYLATAQELDRRNLLLDGVIRPGWVLLGIAALTPVLLSGAPLDASTAVAIGGVLMVGQALNQIVHGVAHLADVWVSWQQTAPILQAGRRGSARDAEIRSALSRRPSGRPTDAPLLRFSDLSLRHGPDRPEVLRGCSQEIHAGDRVLLEGPSGGGKSTLAALLAGLHRPDRGAMTLWGEPFTDFPPEHWRGRIVLVSQFHDNHILTDSLLFNLLLGRCWPPGPGDAEAAERVCERLGLGPLLQRMPQGLAQTVGDGGWALSHGERSRVFLARALLQKDVALVILDESFAALDPETLRGVCRGVLETAPTLLVIAHP
jgi:ATP-binding cassette subfamily B protein